MIDRRRFLQLPLAGLPLMLVDKAVGLLWLLGAIVITALSALATSLVAIVPVPYVAGFVAWLATSVTGALLVWWTHRIMTNVKVPGRSHVPGAIVAGAAMALFQVAGAKLVPSLIASASQTYAALASVFVFLTVLSLLGNVIVYGAVVNVVAWERTHGTSTMTSKAPALPLDRYVELERGGQRPKFATRRPALSRITRR